MHWLSPVSQLSVRGLTFFFFFPVNFQEMLLSLLTDAESNGSQELGDDYRFARNFMVQTSLRD